MGLGDAPLTRVSVFMNVFNCHVNRACIDGTVTNVTYHHGKFLNASLDKASEHNERNSITISRDDGLKIGITQIAGLVARRIVCFVEEGAVALVRRMIRYRPRTFGMNPSGSKICWDF